MVGYLKLRTISVKKCNYCSLVACSRFHDLLRLRPRPIQFAEKVPPLGQSRNDRNLLGMVNRFLCRFRSRFWTTLRLYFISLVVDLILSFKGTLEVYDELIRGLLSELGSAKSSSDKCEPMHRNCGWSVVVRRSHSLLSLKGMAGRWGHAKSIFRLNDLGLRRFHLRVECEP